MDSDNPQLSLKTLCTKKIENVECRIQNNFSPENNISHKFFLENLGWELSRHRVKRSNDYFHKIKYKCELKRR